MGAVKIVRELHGFTGQACLVRRGDEHFVVSSTIVPFSGPETLAFPADENGKVLDWLEVAGGRGRSREETIGELAEASTVIQGEVVRPELEA